MTLEGTLEHLDHVGREQVRRYAEAVALKVAKVQALGERPSQCECGTQFYPVKGGPRNYCSVRCAWLAGRLKSLEAGRLKAQGEKETGVCGVCKRRFRLARYGPYMAVPRHMVLDTSQVCRGSSVRVRRVEAP